MTFDQQVQTTTNDEIVPIITDQTLGSNVFALAVMSKGKNWFGDNMKFPIKVTNHTQGGAFNDFSKFKTANENVRINAQFEPRAYYQSVVIGGIARSINNISKTQLLNLVKVEMESAYQDMVDDVGGLAHGTGTGSDDMEFHGTGAAIDDGSTVDTYGNVSRAAYSVWASDLYTSIGAWDFSKARTLANKATVGTRKPGFYVCNETVFGYVESDYTQSVEGNYNVLEGARGHLTRDGIIPAQRGGLVGQMGFDVLFYGGSPIVKDDKTPSGEMKAINPEFYRWYGVKAVEANSVDLKSMYHDGNDYDSAKVPSSAGFAWTGFVRPADQYAFIGQFLIVGNWICPAPRLQSNGSGITS